MYRYLYVDIQRYGTCSRVYMYKHWYTYKFSLINTKQCMFMYIYVCVSTCLDIATRIYKHSIKHLHTSTNLDVICSFHCAVPGLVVGHGHVPPFLRIPRKRHETSLKLLYSSLAPELWVYWLFMKHFVMREDLTLQVGLGSIYQASTSKLETRAMQSQKTGLFAVSTSATLFPHT